MTNHVKSRVKLVGGVTSSLKPLIGRHSTLTPSTKVLLYKQILRPALLYAAPAWFHLASATARKSVQTLQNKILRQATNSPWFVRNSVIMWSASVPLVKDFVHLATDHLMGSMDTSTWPHVARIAAAERVQLRRPPVAVDAPPEEGDPAPAADDPQPDAPADAPRPAEADPAAVRQPDDVGQLDNGREQPARRHRPGQFGETPPVTGHAQRGAALTPSPPPASRHPLSPLPTHRPRPTTPVPPDDPYSQ